MLWVDAIFCLYNGLYFYFHWFATATMIPKGFRMIPLVICLIEAVRHDLETSPAVMTLSDKLMINSYTNFSRCPPGN